MSNYINISKTIKHIKKFYNNFIDTIENTYNL